MNSLIAAADTCMMRVMLDGSSFIKDFFTHVGQYVKNAGSYVVVIIGVALIIAAACMLVKAFAVRGGANWVVIILCLLAGGVFAFGGWKLITDGQYSGLGKDTMGTLIDGGSAADFNDSGTGQTCLEKARKALAIIANEFIKPFGTSLAVCTGVALIVLAVIQIGKFFFAGGRAQMSWLKVGAMFVIGTVLFVGTGEEGFKWANKIGGISKDTIINMSDGNVGSSKELDADNLKDYSGDSGSNMSADPSDVQT